LTPASEVRDVSARRKNAFPFLSTSSRAILFAVAILCSLELLAERGSADQPEAAGAPGLAATQHAGGRRDANQPEPTKEHIQELIRQLGNARYAARRAAANDLRQIGPEAFDLLYAATDDADPEVAASARYLLRQITVRWVQNDDPPAVRALLRDFDARSDESRIVRVQDLARLAEGQGYAALGRIARFDRSPLVSRMAALAIIRPLDRSSPQVDPELLERELGASTRESAIWLRRYLEQLRDPAASARFWEELVDNETARLQKNADDTSNQIVIGLLWNLADVHRQTGDQQAMLAAIDRMMGLTSEESRQIVTELIEWLVEHQAWGVLDEFLAKHQPGLEQSKRLLYYAALARARQGKEDLAEELAKKAAQIDPQGTLECFLTARDLEEHSQFHWAVREYHRAIDNQPVAAPESILARVYLASLLHDYQQHQQAADVLEPLVNAVQNEGRVGQLYAELLRYYRGRLSLPEADAVAARFHYYLACQFRAAGDPQRERGELELAIKFDPSDADVLIAMYRHPETEPQWRENVRKRIRELCRQFQQEIDDNPTEPTAYNQWAWLVSNTEGDYQKAIRYSHRSLELIPPGAGDSAGASFLDTLGRCYYAAGDYQNALKYQRQAIAKLGYMQVMHRQLSLFEKSLAEKQGAGSREQGAPKSD
jgi:tetratricopeptide (TPR) repeat protein